MIKSIVTYVNFYFPTYKTQFYPDNFIKACLVYQFLYAKYFTQKLDIGQIIYRLTEARHYLNSNSTTTTIYFGIPIYIHGITYTSSTNQVLHVSKNNITDY